MYQNMPVLFFSVLFLDQPLVYFVYEKALLWRRNESMAIFFLSASNPRPIYEISITSGFYLTVSFTSEDKYAMNEGWRNEESIIS